MNYGRKIKRAREAAGLTQQELAAKLQVTQVTVSRWESNDRTPTLDTLVAIAKATAQPITYFFDEEKGEAR